MAKILLLNGPNLNLLGSREPQVYGSNSLADVEARCEHMAKAAGRAMTCLQSNSELALIERLHAARSDETAFIVINPGAFTHTSVAIRDAIVATELPFIEVHLSNVHKREPFRHQSLFSDRAVGVILGFGVEGYEMAMQVALRRLAARDQQ